MSEAYGAELTSLRSPRVKAARQLAKRAMRERARLFLAEGPQAAGEALARDGVVTELFLTAAARDAGCDAFLVKPCLPDDMVAAVRRVLVSRSS